MFRRKCAEAMRPTGKLRERPLDSTPETSKAEPQNARETMTDMVHRRLPSVLMLLITVVITTLNPFPLYDTLSTLI